MLATYEFLLSVCVTRALHTKDAGKITLRQKTMLPSLDRFQSVLDVSSTETLLAQAFQILLAELERVAATLTHQTPLHWPAYEEHELKDVQQQEAKGYESDKSNKSSSGSSSSSGSGSGSDSDGSGSGRESKVGSSDEESDAGSDSDAKSSISKRTKGSLVKSVASRHSSLKASSVKSGGAQSKKSKEGEGEGEGEKKEEEKKEEKKEEEELPEYEVGGGKKEGGAKDKDLKKLNIRNKRVRDKAYSLEFLHRILRMFSLLAGVSTSQPSAMGLLLQVVTPSAMSTLFSLLLLAPPRHKMLVMRIFASLVQVLPQALFEQGLQELTKYSEEGDLEKQLADSAKESWSQWPLFFGWLGSYALELRRTMKQEKPGSEGSYAVSAEILRVMRLCVTSNFKGDGPGAETFSDWVGAQLLEV